MTDMPFYPSAGSRWVSLSTRTIHAVVGTCLMARDNASVAVLYRSCGAIDGPVWCDPVSHFLKDFMQEREYTRINPKKGAADD